MEMKFSINYKQLMELIKQLPASELAKLRADISVDMVKEKSKKESTDLYKLIMEGPTMSDEQHDQFLLNRKHFNQWRVN